MSKFEVLSFLSPVILPEYFSKENYHKIDKIDVFSVLDFFSNRDQIQPHVRRLADKTPRTC